VDIVFTVVEKQEMTQKQKSVKICGNRSNNGALQSWWVDTGIFLNATQSFSINTSNPGGPILPWGSHPGFGPEGDTSGANIDWHESLAYRTSPSVTGVRFGSLIGKIGRDGTVFPVGQKSGQPKTFTASATGTLFLAFNDGVNFQDNTGQWNVTVSFESVVQLAPTIYGTLKINADSINGSLVDTWGVILTVEEGSLSSWTTTATDNLASAFNDIQNRLLARASRMFKQVYAGLELRLSGIPGAGQTISGNGNFVRFGTGTQGSIVRADDRSWGRIVTASGFDYYPSTIGYGFFNAGDKGIRNTIMHELGHILAYRTTSPNDMFTIANGTHFGLKPMPDTTWLPTQPPRTSDTSADIGTFWENLIDVSALNEIVADSFLNWVRNSYVRVGHKRKRRSQTGKVGVTTQQRTNEAQRDDSASDERSRIAGTGGRDVERRSSSSNRGGGVSV